jgi:RHS repeat-associated protein
MADPIELCRYQYDPLDRLAALTPLAQAMARRFYKGESLATELQVTAHNSILRAGNQLLAYKNQSGIALLGTDRQNSVLHAEDIAIAYAPYGHREKIDVQPGLPGFNGEQPDPVTGHYLLGNGYRAYNPVLMRFNSPDSLSPFGKGGFNPYAYCAGDPVNRIDPSGHFGWFRVMANLAARVSSAIGMGASILSSQRSPFIGGFTTASNGGLVASNLASPRHIWAMKIVPPPQSLQSKAIDTILRNNIPISTLPKPMQKAVLNRVDSLSLHINRQDSMKRLRSVIDDLKARAEYGDYVAAENIPPQLRQVIVPGAIIEDYQSLGFNIRRVLGRASAARRPALAPPANRPSLDTRWIHELTVRLPHERY